MERLLVRDGLAKARRCGDPEPVTASMVSISFPSLEE
jgi:hypothetical protein